MDFRETTAIRGRRTSDLTEELKCWCCRKNRLWHWERICSVKRLVVANCWSCEWCWFLVAERCSSLTPSFMCQPAESSLPLPVWPWITACQAFNKSLTGFRCERRSLSKVYTVSVSCRMIDPTLHRSALHVGCRGAQIVRGADAWLNKWVMKVC